MQTAYSDCRAPTLRTQHTERKRLLPSPPGSVLGQWFSLCRCLNLRQRFVQHTECYMKDSDSNSSLNFY